MSSPDPTREYGENEYPSDSPHKDSAWRSSKAKALSSKKDKLNKTQKMTGKWLKDAGKHLRKEGESPLTHLKRLSK